MTISASFRVLVLCIGVLSVPLSGQTWQNGVPAGSTYYSAGNVGINTATPLTLLHVAAPGPNGLLVTNSSTPSGSSGGILYGEVTTAPTDGDQRLGALVFGENDGTANRNSVALAAFSSQAWTAGSAQGSYLSFQITPNNTASRMEARRVTQNGNVGIGTTNPTSRLSVNGTIQAKEVVVNTGWSDYVFQPAYRLKPLSEVAAYIQQNHHLPDIPSEAEVREKGISLGEMQSKLLAKIEELTLHLIRSEDRNRDLEARIARIEGHGASLQPNPVPPAAAPRQP